MCQSRIGLNLGTAKSSHIGLNRAHLIALTPNQFWDSAGQGSSKKPCLGKEGFIYPFFYGNPKKGGERGMMLPLNFEPPFNPL